MVLTKITHAMKALAFVRTVNTYGRSIPLASINLPVYGSDLQRGLAVKATKTPKKTVKTAKTVGEPGIKGSTVEVKTSVIRKALEDLKKKFSFPEYPTTNAYTLFLKENASELKQNAGINKFSMKQLANKWRSMPEAEKNKLRERIMMAKSSYNDTLTKWKNTMQAKKLGNVVQQIDELTRSAAMRGKFQELYLNMELERLQKQYNYPELKRHSPLSLYLHELKTKTKPSEMSRDFLKTSVLKWKALSDEMRARFVDKATRLNSENRALLQKWKESMEKQNLNAVVQQIAQLRRELRAASRDEEVQSKHKVDSTVMENLLAASMKGSSTTVSAP